MVASYLPGTDRTSRKARDRFIRYINLAHALVYKQASHSDDYSDLVEMGLVTPPEVKLLKGLPSQYTVVYSWASHLLREAASAGLIIYPVTTLPQLNADIHAMRGAGADVFMYLNCQIPYNYSHLMTFMTKMHLLLSAVVCGSCIGAGIERQFWSDILWGFLLLFVNNTVYQGLLHVHYQLDNPLAGDGVCDFPQQEYIVNTYRSSRCVIAQLQKNRLPFKTGVFMNKDTDAKKAHTDPYKTHTLDEASPPGPRLDTHSSNDAESGIYSDISVTGACDDYTALPDDAWEFDLRPAVASRTSASIN